MGEFLVNMQALNLTEDRKANLALVEEEKDDVEAEDQMMNLQHCFMVSTTPEVSDNSCTCCSNCIDKIKTYQEKIDSLNKNLEDRAKTYQQIVDNQNSKLEDFSYTIYDLRKNQKPLKEKHDAAVKDYKRIIFECNEKNTQLLLANIEVNKLDRKSVV